MNKIENNNRGNVLAGFYNFNFSLSKFIFSFLPPSLLPLFPPSAPTQSTQGCKISAPFDVINLQWALKKSRATLSWGKTH